MNTQKTSYHHGDLRAALLREAVQMIAEGGIDHVTMRALSHRVGVSRTAPYRHFADKEALLVAVAADGFARLKMHLQAVVSPGIEDDLDRFRGMGVAYIRFAIESPAQYRLMYGREALKRTQYPELDQAANDAYDELVELIETYQQDGKIRSENPEALAYIAWGTVHGLASLLIDGNMRFPDDLEALALQAIQTLLEGVKA